MRLCVVSLSHWHPRRLSVASASKGLICGVYSVSRSGRAVNKERALARQPREWADASSEFVRTSAMLQRIAQSWVADAERADAAAQQHMLRF